MAWSEVTLLQLVDCYKEKTILWDPKHVDYFKKNLKEDAWREIGEEMDMTGEACKNKIVVLLAAYRREKNKEKKSIDTGKGRKDVYKSRWFAYDAMKFLEDRDKPRERLTSEEDEVIENVALVDVGEEEIQREEEFYRQETDVGINSTSTAELVPPRTKRSRKRIEDQQTALMSSAYSILETAAKSFNKEPSQFDENETFCNFIAKKLKNYTPTTQSGVQHAIFEILKNADSGFYEWSSSYAQPPYMYSSALPPNNTQHPYDLSFHTPPPAASVTPSTTPSSTASTRTSTQSGSTASSSASNTFDNFI